MLSCRASLVCIWALEDICDDWACWPNDLPCSYMLFELLILFISEHWFWAGSKWAAVGAIALACACKKSPPLTTMLSSATRLMVLLSQRMPATWSIRDARWMMISSLFVSRVSPSARAMGPVRSVVLFLNVYMQSPNHGQHSHHC